VDLSTGWYGLFTSLSLGPLADEPALENPEVREVFFPNGASDVAIETASATDEPEIRAIAERHCGPLRAELISAWLALAPELGIERADVLDVESRELIVDGHRVSPTQLEFGVMQYLAVREGKVASRIALESDVWGDSRGQLRAAQAWASIGS
jgi:hypothetical protein